MNSTPLWFSLYLPTHSLDVHFPRWPAEARPAAVLLQDRVCACTPAAQAKGVRPGMRSSTALGLAPDILLAPDQAQARHDHLQEIALCLLQYTPNVAFFEESALLLEAGASLSLFHGARRLHARIRASLDNMGVRARIGMAPTALGAWMLACRSRPSPRRVISHKALARRLDCLPCHALPAARPFGDWLDGIACRNLAQLRALPRKGLQQRSSPLLLQELDQAYGDGRQSFPWFQAPERFNQRYELTEHLEHCNAILAVAGRLIEQLCGWLHARQRAARVLDLRLHHEKGRHARAPTCIVLRLSEDAWLPENFMAVLDEQLQSLSLEAPVISLELSVTQALSRPAASLSLFPEPEQWLRQEHRMLDLLQARLGRDRVLHACPSADYRPEQANRWQAATARDGAAQMPPALSGQARPFWLLPRAERLDIRNDRPVYKRSGLRLILGPERLETGWWDATGHEQRDYFIAQDELGARYWVYQQREGDGPGWFLHGFFG
ncbi:MAG TPA: DNA polymerase Y family protein [Burkholderiaceae bacterium]|nr:DNA polymerase Y family protein [Burkholderiaceae bacterium]